jgi:CRP-like cAMP-binding protein
MNTDLIISNVLKRIKLNDSEIDLFISLLDPVHVPKKEYLLRHGDICSYDYFIDSGCVKVCYINERGLEHIVKFAIEDWWVVDLDSFLNRTHSFYYIQAVENTAAFRLSKSNYDSLHQRIPAFEKFSKARWQNNFIAIQQRVGQNLSLTAEERYQHFKVKYPGLELRISQKLIASYLGITPEFLSVLRRRNSISIS